MSQMYEDAAFADSLAPWATVPAAAVEVVETWKAASSLVVDSPIGGLRADAAAGTLNPKNVVKRLTDAGQVIAAQVTAPQLVAELDGPWCQRFADAVLADGDRIVGELAGHFDKYARQIPEYAPLVRPGITAEDLLSTASADVLAAWQNLGVVEATLEQIAHFRVQLSTRYGYPAPTPSIAAWIAPAGGRDGLERASLAWRGHKAVGAPDAGVTVPLEEVRGGRWRWLVEAGFELRCNDQHEAAVVAAPVASAPVAA